VITNLVKEAAFSFFFSVKGFDFWTEKGVFKAQSIFTITTRLAMRVYLERHLANKCAVCT